MRGFLHAPARERAVAFSLVELMAAMVVLALLLIVLGEATNSMRDTVGKSTRRIETFKETRTAFEAMARRVGQATLNSYWGYDNPENPKKWNRQSELHFTTLRSDPDLSDPNPTAGHAIFFQAPFGYAGTEARSDGDPGLDYLDGLLNGWGYYVEYRTDLPERTPFMAGEINTHPERMRFRLMECRIPAENLTVMAPPALSADGVPQISLDTTRDAIHGWFTDPDVRGRFARPIAENVVALLVSPRAPDETSVEGDPIIAPAYEYDSRLHQYSTGGRAELLRHQLPEILDLTLVATDEISWVKFEAFVGSDAAEQLRTQINQLFTTAADYENDIEELEEWMLERHLEPRVFRLAISMRGAKFSTEGDRGLTF